MKNTTRILLATVALFLAGGTQVQAGQCIDVGGSALGQAVTPTSLVASLDGTFAGARAEITSQQETESGLLLGMEHYFISDENGFIKTQDKAVFTVVPGKDKAYFIEIDYNVVEAGGNLEGYRGTFHSFGGFKMDQGKITLRYRGKICK